MKPKNYDETLKAKLWAPIHYDRMIALICKYNPMCKDEAWACDAINICIRNVGDDGVQSSATGCCMALRHKDQVRLFLEPLIPQSIE
jgi:hypothetical protein